MHNLIEQLADRAHQESVALYYKRMETEHPSQVIFYDIFNRTFAELILAECIDLIRPTEHHHAWAQSYLGGVDGLELLEDKVRKLKEHFGVEESKKEKFDRAIKEAFKDGLDLSGQETP